MIVASFFAPRFEKYEGVDYDELLMLLDRSCKRLGLKHIVISDGLRPKPLRTFLTKLPDNLMHAILYGQMRFMEESSEPILLVGADCLITKKCGLNSDSIQDMAITISKTFSDCEMNTGAIWVKSGKECAKVWKKGLEFNPKDWGDDQICLYRAMNESNLNIMKLSCEEYNWAPRDLEDDANMPVVVHFRGKRKRFMKDWARRYLGLNLDDN